MACLVFVLFRSVAPPLPPTRQESRWDTFSAFCAERVSELEAAQAESKEHALSDEYTLTRLFQRYVLPHEAFARESSLSSCSALPSATITTLTLTLTVLASLEP